LTRPTKGIALDSSDAQSEKVNERLSSPVETGANPISRRQFGRQAALAAAAAVGAPVLLTAEPAPPNSAPSQEGKPEPLEGLTPQQVAEVDAKLANILRKYGHRFDADQKAHLRRILAQNERLMMPVRAFALKNGDPPASVLRINFDETSSPEDERKS
jgi:hypothetical protein